ncbi:hypothetical protein HY251_18125 [bacterium]|nr:hypothetical protein [bacterium]
MRVSQAIFAMICATSIGQMLFAAPPGALLVGTPAIEKVVPGNPSIRHGSAGPRSHWIFTGGGYHGGK